VKTNHEFRALVGFSHAEVGDAAETWKMADGSEVCGEYGWTTSTDCFDDRDEEVKLIRQRWLLIEEEEEVLPSPYTDDEPEDDDD
jgi:hypothetical protein